MSSLKMRGLWVNDSYWISFYCFIIIEPRYYKTNKVSVRPAKTQISLGIRPVWSESSLSAWGNLGFLATHGAHSEDSDQTGRMPRLIWVFAGRTFIVLVLSCRGSYYNYFRMIYSPAPLHYICFLGSRKKSKLKTEQQRSKWKHAFKFNTDEICK